MSKDEDENQNQKKKTYTLKSVNGTIYDSDGKEITEPFATDENSLEGRAKADLVFTPFDSIKHKRK